MRRAWPVSGMGMPPVMRAEPGAAAAPEAVGTDTGVLLFGVDTARARYLRWETWRDVESIRLDVGGGRIVTVELARSAESLRQYTAEGVPFDVNVFAEEAAFDQPFDDSLAEGRSYTEALALDTFEFGLARLLDGVEVYIDQVTIDQVTIDQVADPG